MNSSDKLSNEDRCFYHQFFNGLKRVMNNYSKKKRVMKEVL